jgi:hypothetical protein
VCVYDLRLPEKLYSEVSVVVPIIKGVKVFNDEYVRRSCVSVQRMSSRYIYVLITYFTCYCYSTSYYPKRHLRQYSLNYNLKPRHTTHTPLYQLNMYFSSSRQNFSLALPLILILAISLFAMPATAQNPIANSYYCRMRCDASFAICVNSMGKSLPYCRRPTLSPSSQSLTHHIFQKHRRWQDPSDPVACTLKKSFPVRN